MRSQEKCTPLGPVHREILLFSEELIILSDRLGRLVARIRPRGNPVLAEIKGVLRRVRADLLSDAIESLTKLPHLTEDAVLRKHADLADLAEQLAGDA